VPECVDFNSTEMTSVNGELDPRVRELCLQIIGERDQARMLKLITELNDVLQRSAGQLGQLGRDANQVATD